MYRFHISCRACVLLQHLADRVAMYIHAHTLYSSVRPFGSSVMLGCHDEDGPSLYLIDPSGIYHVSCYMYVKSEIH